ncbi:MAG: histidine phosphatase family protein [Elusimicrobia bacterium]|nr:histidine phosphatase family protein [Elusimicrobiota bacterium]
MLSRSRLSLLAVLVLAAATANAGVVGAAPVARVAFQAVLAGQLREYMTLAPAAGLSRLEALTALPSRQFPALAGDRAAAAAALALITSPQASQLREDRETKVMLSRALGKENVALIATAAGDLQARAAGDPALSAAVERARGRFGSPNGADIERLRADLKKLFDGALPASGWADPAPRVILPAGGGLIENVVEESGGFVYASRGDDGRIRRHKVYPQDGLTFERREIPAVLAGIYAELPGGAVRQIAPDPLVAALNAARIELWTLRHGESDANRARLLSGSGIDAALTETPNERGVSGEIQARAAALKMYENLGGDGWARSVLAGLQRPLVILTSPLKRTRQTAAALQELLDQRGRFLSKGPPRRLYEAHVERGLRELAYGEFEGVTLDAVEAFASWPAFDAVSGAGRTFLDRFPKGESRFDVMIRQRGVLRRMIQDYPGRQVVTFTHWVALAAQRAVLGLIDRDPADQALRDTFVENAQPVRLTFPGARLLALPPSR